MPESADQTSSTSGSPTPANPVGTLPLNIPEDIRYNCSGCGRCCQGWAIGLTPEDYARIKDVDWGSLNPDLADKQLFLNREHEHSVGKASHPYFTKAGPDGSCPFLINKRCFVHATLGEDQKPLNCRLFPYTFVPTPAGIYVGLVYGSPAVLANQGELLSNQRAHLEEMWRVNVEAERAKGKISAEVAELASAIVDAKDIVYKVDLMPGSALTWEEFLVIENRLMQEISRAEVFDVFPCLLAMSEVMSEAIRLKDNALPLDKLNEFQPNTGKWEKFAPGFFEKLVFNLLCFKTFTLSQLITKLNPTTSSELSAIAVDTIKAGFKAVLMDKPDLPVVGTVNISKARVFDTGPLPADVCEFLRRYLTVRLFSKTYCGSTMAGLSMSAGFNFLAGNVLSAVVFAKSYAQHYKRNTVELADFHEAFFYIDRAMVGMSQMSGDKGSIFDQGFSSPNLFNRLIARTKKSTGG